MAQHLQKAIILHTFGVQVFLFRCLSISEIRSNYIPDLRDLGLSGYSLYASFGPMLRCDGSCKGYYKATIRL